MMVGVLYAILAAALLFQVRFVVLGDRSGEPRAGVYEQVWREAAMHDPAFAVSVGDTIQGQQDTAAEAEWQQVMRIVAPYRRFPLYLAPGNHDIWSPRSQELFRKYSGHEPHYSFDHGPVHFTVLDNSRSDELPAGELAFLENDLKAHRERPVKFIVSHRPSWLVDALFRNSDSALHALARRYGVRHVIAGHVHQMLRFELDGVEYVSVPSAGGHLRGSRKYKDGWFFGYTVVEVRGAEVRFEIHELKAPHGEGRVTGLADWGAAGLK